MVRTLPLTAVRPSQLFLSSQKLAASLEWFDFSNPSYEPLPAAEYDDELYLLDGHTRAFVAYLGGLDELRIIRDEHAFRQHQQLYIECFTWCAEARIQTIGDLSGRVLAPEAYQERWINRCQRTAEQLE